MVQTSTMDSIQKIADEEKKCSRINKFNQTYFLKIFQQLNKQQNDLKSSKRTKETNDLSSLLAYYEHQILDLSDLSLSREEHFNSNHCLFCKDKSQKKFKLRSFKENKKKITFLFKICSACGRWEKLHEAKMIKPIRSKLKKISKLKKMHSNQMNKSFESKKLTKFSLNDLKKLKSSLKK